MTGVARMTRATTHERLTALEERAKTHEQMAVQVKEMYELLTRWRNINWFFVKLAAIGGGGLGALAVLLTIMDKALQLLGHH
jgi:hypothetical protein